MEVGTSHEPPYGKDLSPEVQTYTSGNGKSVRTVVNGFGDGVAIADNVSTTLSSNYDESVLRKAVKVDRKSNGRATLVSGDDDLASIEGNMCASATGVVRVQSRKKAEMFLVRTDGFSCSREKVTESSLAFTHPSTQQQMLMWKSTPKTVLVLKKLGQELMQQAKEVPSKNLVFVLKYYKLYF